MKLLVQSFWKYGILFQNQMENSKRFGYFS